MRPAAYSHIGTITGIIGLLLMMLTPSFFGGDLDILSWTASAILIANFWLIPKVSKHKEHRRTYITLFIYVLANISSVGTISFWHYSDAHSDPIARLDIILAIYASAPRWHMDGNMLSNVCASFTLLMLIFETIAVRRTYSRKNRAGEDSRSA